MTVVILFFMVISIININNHDGNGLFGYKFFVVLSDSMKPEFQAGDLVISKTINPDELQVGDIITFYSGSSKQFIVTHQIQEKVIINSKEAYVTKGINVEQPDEKPVYADNVIGKYSFSIPSVGYIFNFLRTPMGYVVLIFIPYMIILFYYGFKLFKLIKEYKIRQKQEMEDKQRILEEERQKNEKLTEELNMLKKQLSSESGNNGAVSEPLL